MTHAAVIGIFIDETLAETVHHHPFQHFFRRIQRQHGKAMIHAQQIAPGAQPHQDAHAQVTCPPPGRLAAGQFGRVTLQHRPVVDETTGGEHHPATRAQIEPLAGSIFNHQADHPSVTGADQLFRRHPQLHLHAQPCRRSMHQLHQLTAAGLVVCRRHVAARCRLGLLAERPGLLTARVIQRIRAVRQLLVRGKAGRIAHAKLVQPVEMGQAAFAIQLDARRLGMHPGRCDQVVVHVLHAVVETKRLLQRRTAAHVTDAARQARRTAGQLEFFQHGHFQPLPCALNCCRHPGRARAHHQQVSLAIPLANLAAGRGLHGCGAERTHCAHPQPTQATQTESLHEPAPRPAACCHLHHHSLCLLLLAVCPHLNARPAALQRNTLAKDHWCRTLSVSAGRCGRTLPTAHRARNAPTGRNYSAHADH